MWSDNMIKKQLIIFDGGIFLKITDAHAERTGELKIMPHDTIELYKYIINTLDHKTFLIP